MECKSNNNIMKNIFFCINMNGLVNKILGHDTYTILNHCKLRILINFAVESQSQLYI